MAKKNGPKTYHPGKLHWRKGFQSLQTLIADSKPHDSMAFPPRIYQIKEKVNIRHALTLSGAKGSIIAIPNTHIDKQDFDIIGFHVTNGDYVHFEQLTIESDNGVYAIDVPETFTGKVLINNLTTRHHGDHLLNDNPMRPSLRIRNAREIVIQDSKLDYIDIVATQATVQLVNTTIGNFTNSSTIKAQAIVTQDTTIHNTEIVTTSGRHTDFKTHGGLALHGAHQFERMQLLPLNPPRPELYPEAMTYIVTLPGTHVHITDIKSNASTSAPQYLYFNLNKTQLDIQGTITLPEQALSSISRHSQLNAKATSALPWLINPSDHEITTNYEHYKQKRSF